MTVGRADDDPTTQPADASADTLAATPAAHARTPPADDPRGDYPGFLPVDPQHYVRGRELARGGMGRIRVARDRRLGRAVAVKEILVSHAPGTARRFEREARITARLQHPSIVNVHEAGVWASGELFYAMTLVTGRSLDEVVAAARTLDDRLALLPNVLALADAMAYAHAQRVIHRDLKPRNVLVGGFGETVVIDWGLAKDLAERDGEAESPGATGRGAGDGVETVAGDVMGTPAYMPPEQAAGRPVDARADVYAIGAILDHVLAGQPAYAGGSGAEVLEAVRRGPPTPLAERQAGVPPDLLAIVTRAMARDAADRYLTAGELADDLRRYQTGQLVGAHRYSLRQLLGRWLRRHRAPVSVAAVALVVLLGLGGVAIRRIVAAERLADQRRVQAEEQSRLAHDSRGEAEQLLGFMLGDLRQRLEPLGQLELLDEVAKKAVDYYDRRQSSLGEVELGKRALALRNLGDVLSAQGHADEALREYQAGLALHQRLAAAQPGSAARQAEVAASHDEIGDVVLRAKGDAAAALTEYQVALAIHDQLAAADPASPSWQRAQAASHERVGNVRRAQGDAAAALAEYHRSLALFEALAAAEPTSAERQRDVSSSRIRIGNVRLAQGDSAGALEEYRRSLTIDEGLVARAPASIEYQRDLSISQLKVGNVLLAQGDLPGALVAYQASRSLRLPMAARDLTNADRQRDLAVSHEKVGNVLLAQGQVAAALAEYRAGLAIDEALAARDPGSAVRQRDLSVMHVKLGDVLLAQADPAGALVEYRRSLVIDRALAAKDPTSADRQADVVYAHRIVGDALLAQRDAAAALVEYRTSLALAGTLAARDVTNAERQGDLAAAHDKVGDALAAQGDRAGALAAFQAGLPIAQRLQERDPTNADFRKLTEVLAAKVQAQSGPSAPR